MHNDETTHIPGVEGDAEPPETAQEPPSPPAAPEPEPDTPEPLLAHRRPRNVAGHYVVLCAFPPHDDDRDLPGPRYLELGWTKANDDGHAKRIASRCPVWGPRIRAGAAEKGGVILRAVAGRSWQKTEPTKIKADPRLVIG